MKILNSHEQVYVKFQNFISKFIMRLKTSLTLKKLRIINGRFTTRIVQNNNGEFKIPC